MAYTRKAQQVRFAKQALKAKVKPGHRIVVSQALVRKGRSNLTPRLHVKRGDLVMVVSGATTKGRGKTGKVLKVLPKTGQVIVEGINVITKATRKKTPTGQSGLLKKEAPIAASKVMLYSTKSKKPVRAEFREAEEIE